MTQASERLVLSNKTKQDIIYNEHLIRYQLASQLVAGKKVLDVASGSGYGSQLLAKAGASQVVGVDISSESVEQAKVNYQADNLEYIVDSAESLKKLEDKSFDIIVSFETIEHLQNYQAYLQALKRVAKDEAIILISTPNKQAFAGVNNPFHIKEFTKQEFVSALKGVWSEVKLLEQYNALASIIHTDSQATQLLEQKPELTLYFLAICSNQAIELKLENVVSTNQQALNRWQNHPAIKLVDGLYKLLVKLKIKS